MKIALTPVAILLSLFIFSCCPYKEKLEKTREIGAEAVTLYGPPLAKTVMASVQKSGFEKSVEFCAGFAPGYEQEKNSEILALFKEKHGVKNFTIKRTSLKLRNPNNSPDNVEKEMLLAWDKDEKEGKKAEPIAKYKNGTFYYLAPIRIASPACIGCHGADDVRDSAAYSKIQGKYPDDKAVGYALDDLRGAFAVTIEY